MNDTAAWLWEKAAELGDFTEEQLADEICKEYDVEKSQALSDITKIVANWKEIGLIL